MTKKIIAILFVLLFIGTVFSGTIAVSNENIITEKNNEIIKKEKISKTLEELNVEEIMEYLENSNCSAPRGVINIFGEDFNYCKGSRINITKGKGLHLIRRNTLIKIKQKKIIRFFYLAMPLAVAHQFWYFIDYQDENAKTEVIPDEGEPFWINGSHTMLVALWHIPIVNKLMTIYSRILYGISKGRINLTFPYSIAKYKYKNFINWASILGTIDGLIWFIFWTLPTYVSFSGFITPIEVRGYTPFVIWTNNSVIH